MDPTLTIAASRAPRLLRAFEDLARPHALDEVIAIARDAARDLTGADGVTFVLREEDLVFYADENAIGPLWKGRRFPAKACISGWCIEHREAVVIEDIYADPRIPHDAYRPTFVKSLAMMPIRHDDPIGAIGAYWATCRRATEDELGLLRTLAGATAIALANVELVKKAQHAVTLRDDFICIASHELKTPLTPIKLHLQRLLQTPRAREGAKIVGALQTVTKQVERLEVLVERLLDVTQLSEGVLRLEYEDLDLAELVRAAIERFSEEGRPSGSSIELRTEGPLVGHWDRLRLEQVVDNLLANALRFGLGKPIVVEVGPGGAASARVRVRDQGIGIGPEDQARIFDRFERAVSTRHFGGFGLGLWIVKRIVESHGGYARVESEPGVGSCFEVVLPRDSV